MATIDYILGERGTLGFPADDFGGTPMDLRGLDLRLVIFRAGDDLMIEGYASSGQIAGPGGGEIEHPSIITFDVTPDEMPTVPRAYPATLQINDGTGWRTMPDSDFVLNVRNP